MLFVCGYISLSLFLLFSNSNMMTIHCIFFFFFLCGMSIQDELTIAREIVINDAEASLRHKLTKRSTQEDVSMHALLWFLCA